MVVAIYKLENAALPVCKLGYGEHFLGRGQALQCYDKRVSRKHIQISISEDGSTIASKHEINAAFYRPAANRKISVLRYNLPVALNDGDEFGFFPDQHWFKVKTNPSEVPDSSTPETDRVVNHGEPIATDSSTTETDRVVNHEEPVATDVTDSSTTETNRVEEPVATDVKVISTTETDRVVNHEELEATDATVCVKEEPVDTEEESAVRMEPSDAEGSTVRMEADSTDGNAEIKREPEDSQPRVKEEPEDTAPQVKEEVVSEEEVDAATSSAAPSDNQQPKKIYKDRCWYGSGCYRRNGDHRRIFSHPGDADYNTDPDDDRPQCQYGGNCYRRNPIHRRDFKHSRFANTVTQLVLPAPVNKPKRKRNKRRSEGSDDGAVSSANIVTTKRTRKIKKQPDTPEDDYDFEDPFIDDGSDDEFFMSSEESDSDYDNFTGGKKTLKA